METEMTTIETTVNGYDCQAHMTSYDKGYPGSHEEPPEPASAEFEILDEYGCEWLALEESMTEDEAREIEHELIVAYVTGIEDERACRKLDELKGK